MKNQFKQQEAALVRKANEVQKTLDGINAQINAVREVRSGDKPEPKIARLIKSQRFSYGIKFTRKKELRQVAKPGLTFTSDRRFATRKEANQHGTRFAKKHGHRAFVVIRVNKRANAWINWETGKTNPVL